MQTTWSATSICYTIIIILIKWVAVILNCYIDVKPLKHTFWGSFFIFSSKNVKFTVFHTSEDLYSPYTLSEQKHTMNVLPKYFKNSSDPKKRCGQSLFVPLNTYPTDTNAAFSKDATQICLKDTIQNFK